MSCDYFKDEEKSHSGKRFAYDYDDDCKCDNRKYRDHNERCGEDDNDRDNCKKEFLGKSVSECKYFRVCKKRFYEPEKKRDNDRCDCCRRRCECCK